jgi:hypothetical protein
VVPAADVTALLLMLLLSPLLLPLLSRAAR